MTYTRPQVTLEVIEPFCTSSELSTSVFPVDTGKTTTEVQKRPVSVILHVFEGVLTVTTEDAVVENRGTDSDKYSRYRRITLSTDVKHGRNGGSSRTYRGDRFTPLYWYLDGSLIGDVDDRDGSDVRSSKNSTYPSSDLTGKHRRVTQPTSRLDHRSLSTVYTTVVLPPLCR